MIGALNDQGEHSRLHTRHYAHNEPLILHHGIATAYAVKHVEVYALLIPRIASQGYGCNVYLLWFLSNNNLHSLDYKLLGFA